MSAEPRRSLSHVGGTTHTDASAPEATLARAILAAAQSEPSLPHVHGFHSYPARMHPQLARTAIERLSTRGQTVLDPFCGSGTVLVEALLLERSAWGVDANPLSGELCWLKTQRLTEPLLQALQLAGDEVVEQAEDRRLRRLGPTRPYAPAEREWFEVHILLELDGLRHAIARQRSAVVRRVLSLIFSALLIKVSRQRSDADHTKTDKRLASGFTLRFFHAKLTELLERWQTFSRALPGPVRAKHWLGDARELANIEDQSVDLIVTSPPYAGVFDYATQHQLRLHWLGFDPHEFVLREIGSRQKLQPLSTQEALGTWATDWQRCLQSFRRVLKPGAAAAILMADSMLQGRAVYADALTGELCGAAGFELTAHAWQLRPSFSQPERNAFRARPRAEHLLLLRPKAGARIRTPRRHR